MIGVVGAGTMGSLIAALGCVAGHETLLWDPVADALERGVAHAREELAGGAERGRWEAGLGERLQPADGVGAFADCEVVIEAAPERLDVKQSLFGELSA